jgi:hypothetical protein
VLKLTASTSPAFGSNNAAIDFRQQEPSLVVVNIDMERDIDVSGFHHSSPLRCLDLGPLCDAMRDEDWHD